MSDWERKETLLDDGRVCLELRDNEGFALRNKGPLMDWMAWPDYAREMWWCGMALRLSDARKAHAI